MTQRTLGELLRHHRLTASLKQAELAEMLGYDTSHISRVERNQRPPTAEYIEQFIEKLHLPETERANILNLYQQTSGDEFDVPSPPKVERHADWGEAPDVSVFYGREAELARLQQWLVADQCRLVAVLGMGGIGKTTLATRLAVRAQDEFEYLIWRSLRNTPPLGDIIGECLQFLADQPQTELPETVDRQISLLVEHLQAYRCLLILDNAESILDEGDQAGHYQPGYEDYGQLIRRVGETQHQSCLLLTSREKPREFARLEDESGRVRSLPLYGVSQHEGREILKGKRLSGSDDSWADLNRRYSGNPLALKLVSETIREIFSGDITEFLNQETSIFGGIREILGEQFERLSALEQSILYWLAIEREAILLEDLRDDIVEPGSHWALLEALNSLGRRSLVERSPLGFTLQNVVLEYVTDRFTDSIFAEISGKADLSLFQTHALVKAQAKDYIRQSQTRLILKPVVERLLAALGQAGLEERLGVLLTDLRRTSDPHQPGYAAGNVLNILITLEGRLSDYDFSRLTIWQAHLRDVELQDVNFTEANLARSVFTETFGIILSLAFSPDGQLLAVGTTDSEVRLWQDTTSRQILICNGHSGWVRSVAFSPDGSLLASGSSDRTIRLWSPQTGQCLRTLEGHTDRIRSVSFSPDGRLLASGSDDQTIRLWNVDSGDCLRMLEGHNDAVRSVAISPGGDLLASGSRDQTIRLWSIGSGQSLRTLEGHQHMVESVAFSPDGRIVASGSRDRTVCLWRVDSGQCLNTLRGHLDRIRTIVFSPIGKLLSSGSYDGTVRLWDVEAGQSIKTLQGHTNWVRAVAFSPDAQSSTSGPRLVSGGDDKTLRWWDVRTGQCLNTLQGYSNQVWSVACSPDGRMLASGSEDQTVRLWDADSGQCLMSLKGHANRVTSVTFSPDGLTCASSSDDQTIRLWQVETGQLLKTLEGHRDRVPSVSFSPDGTMLASGSGDQTVRLWHVETGQCLATLRDHTNRVWSVDFSPDGLLLASTSGDQTVRIWDVRGEQSLQVLEGHAGRVFSAVFSPDGRILASSGSDGMIRLWDVETGQRLKILEGHIERVWSVAFSPDGAILASSGEDQTVRLWNVDSGALLNTLRGHASRIRMITFLPDGNRLASCSDDGTLKLWQRQTGTCVQTLRSDRPYERMDITGVQGLTEAQKDVLKTLGAVTR